MNDPIYTADQFVPTSIEEALIQEGDQNSSSSWHIARIVQNLIRQYHQAQQTGADLRFRQMDLYHYAARKARKAERTIRLYFAVAEFYPPRIEHQYSILSFDHFKTAMGYGTLSRAIQLFEACLGQMERNGGGVPTVEWMEAFANPQATTAYEIDLAGEFVQPTPPDNPVTIEAEIPSDDPRHLPPAAARAATHHLTEHHEAEMKIVALLPDLPEDLLTRFISAHDQMGAAIIEVGKYILDLAAQKQEND